MPIQPIDYAEPTVNRRWLVALASKRVKRWLASLTILWLCYVGSYIALSACGQYEPAMLGTNYVKWYSWAPAGFVKDYRHRESLFLFYLPLYMADRDYWHRDDDAYTGKYPIHIPKSAAEVSAAGKKK